MKKSKRFASLFWHDEGFSTVGMALALLITLSLIFTCARVYEIQTASAQVQDVADAAALAAENVIAEFYIVVTVCDALTFTLSLALVVALGIGTVCACIPATASLSKALFEAADQIRSARDSFYQSAQDSLTTLQNALPFIATVKAQQVMNANSRDGSAYQGIVVLAPWSSDSASEVSFEATDSAWESVNETHDELSECAEEAEQAAQKADEWKEYAYRHDSGSQTQYCMYERAHKLAGLSGSANPYFSSVDTWDFAVALQRAQDYYQARYQNESAQTSSIDEQVNSILRKRFYRYAQGQVAQGYVRETDTSFEAFFPLLPKNTSEMRSTELYTEAVYPITQDPQGQLTMHAWSGCPAASSGTGAGVGSIRDMDTSAAYVTCPTCKFKPSSMGKVAAASSSIENGFEYHYNEVARAAQEYEKARERLDPLAQRVKELADASFDAISDAFREIASQRIQVSPPGALGAIALVIDTGRSSSHFSSAFLSENESLGVRAAVSSATLVSESSDEGENILTSFLDGVTPETDVALGATQFVLAMWSGLLHVYAQGQEMLSSSIEELLNAIPLASHSGLGTWASDAFEECVADAGFEAPDLRARKAVLVNSAHVLSADDSTFSARLLSAKRQALTAGNSGMGFEGALASLESTAQGVIKDMSSEFTVATLVIFDGAVEIPLVITLPTVVTEGLSGAFQKGIDALRGMVATWTGVRQWR